MKENSKISSYVFYHNLNNSVFGKVLLNGLKEIDVTPPFFIKKNKKNNKNKCRPVSILPNALKSNKQRLPSYFIKFAIAF